jgi:GNAT superfamily N-acetyltransferase
MVEKRDWKILDGNEKDMERILSLRKLVFGEEEKDKLDPRFWKWEFIKNPHGKALIYMVVEGEKIIGHFADLPRRFFVKGQKVLGTLSLDLMVHPEYQRRGIFEKMGRYAIQRVDALNGLFLMAYPIREETIHGLMKIGWKKVVKLPVLVYPIRFQGIVDRYLHFQPLSLLLGGVAGFFHFLFFHHLIRAKKNEEIEINQVDQLDGQFDQFCEKTATLYPIMGIRDQNYMSWRYFQHPTRRYTLYRAIRNGEMMGYIVLRKVELLNFNSAVIVDLLALDEETVSALVKRGIQHSQQGGADLLGFMVPQGHSYDKILRRMGFLPSPKTFSFMIYSHSDKEVFHSPGKWYVNWGDTDVI